MISPRTRRAAQARVRSRSPARRGLVGRALVPFLTTGVHRVLRLVHGAAEALDTVRWDPEHAMPLTALDGVDAVVHLAGENIASGRWTLERKRKIHESRAKGTRVLAEALAALPHPPRVLVSASAIGIYGDRGGASWPDECAGRRIPRRGVRRVGVRPRRWRPPAHASSISDSVWC
jgi:NAD dependent epimerase/dehydratase family enzyme